MPAKRNNMITVVLVSYFICSACSLLGAENTIKNSFEEPENILTDISNRGAHIVATEIYSDTEKWSFVLKRIATGDETWLYVAVALRSGTDSAISEMLSLAVGEALEITPENVLRIAFPEFPLISVCGGPDIDDSRYDSYARVDEAIKRRQKKVSTITAPDLTGMGRECIQALEKSKEESANFYEQK